MTHPDEPSGVNMSTRKIYETSNANLLKADVNVDPWERYALVMHGGEFDSSGDDVLKFEIANRGTDMHLKRVLLAQSQGAEDGRYEYYMAYRDGEGSGLNEDELYAWKWTPQDGGGTGLTRTHALVDIPEELQAVLSHDSEHYCRMAGDSSSTDATKCFVSSYWVPSDSPAAGATL